MLGELWSEEELANLENIGLRALGRNKEKASMFSICTMDVANYTKLTKE